MLWAIKDGERILATPRIKAICPSCREELIPKCGSIKIWHWSHKFNGDCDSWYEPESEWHLKWKNEFPKEQQEVIIEKNILPLFTWSKNKHIADIKTDKLILELQNSPISRYEIMEREYFYGNMVWLFNGEKFAKNLELRSKGSYCSFRWKYPHKSLWSCEKRIFIDLGNNIYDSFYFSNKILYIRKIYHNIPCGGWGLLLSKEEFLKNLEG